MLAIEKPEVLHIEDGDKFHYGGNQAWFRTFMQRKAGCGPTCAAHIIWYLASTRQELRGITIRNAGDKTGFVLLMEDMWRYVTPGLRGANSTEFFTEGLPRYGREHGHPIECVDLQVPADKDERPDKSEFIEFAAQAIKADAPVAFLNLHNGGIEGLDSWHWVTLVGIDQETGIALIYDQGKQLKIDLAAWLEQTEAGGGLVKVVW